MIVLPDATYNAQSRSLPSVNIPVGVTAFEFRFDTTNWTNPSRALSFSTEISQDAGATWQLGPGMLLDGDKQPSLKDGTKVVWLSCGLANPQNPDRRIRATISFSGPSWRTSGELNWIT